MAQRLAGVEVGSFGAFASGAAAAGARFERCASCLWEGAAQLVLDRLQGAEPYLSPDAAQARAVAAAALDSLQEELAPRLWAAFGAAAARAEAELRGASAAPPPLSAGAGAAAAAAAAAPEAPRALPPGATQLQPLVESYFLLADAARAAHAPLDVLAAEAAARAAEDAGGMAGTGGGGVINASPSLASPERAHSQLAPSQSFGDAGAGPSAGGGGASPEARAPQAPHARFAERHRALLNALIHRTPALLSGPLALLLRTPRLIDFDNK